MKQYFKINKYIYKNKDIEKKNLQLNIKLN